jgi:hypothetical protein
MWNELSLQWLFIIVTTARKLIFIRFKDFTVQWNESVLTSIWKTQSLNYGNTGAQYVNKIPYLQSNIGLLVLTGGTVQHWHKQYHHGCLKIHQRHVEVLTSLYILYWFVLHESGYRMRIFTSTFCNKKFHSVYRFAVWLAVGIEKTIIQVYKYCVTAQSSINDRRQVTVNMNTRSAAVWWAINWATVLIKHAIYSIFTASIHPDSLTLLTVNRIIIEW